MPLKEPNSGEAPDRSMPLTAEQIAAGLHRMAEFFDPDRAARKVAMDFALSRPHPERTNENG